MTRNHPTRRKNFRSLEKDLTKVILLDLLLFLLVMALSSIGIGWLKILVGIVTIVLSGLGVLFLALIDELPRSRSRWMVVAFLCLLVCTLMSLITGSPAAA